MSNGSERIQGVWNRVKWFLPNLLPRLDAYVDDDGRVFLFWMKS